MPHQRRNDDLANTPAKRKDDLYIKLSDKVPILGGSEASISGRNALYLIIAIAAAGLAFVHDSTARAEHKALLEIGERLVKELRINTYVVSLPDDRRRLLDFAEPKDIQELREMREWQKRNQVDERK